MVLFFITNNRVHLQSKSLLVDRGRHPRCTQLNSLNKSKVWRKQTRLSLKETAMKGCKSLTKYHNCIKLESRISEINFKKVL